MKQDYIIIKGAKQHNLKNIDLQIPRDKLVVVTGLSGSGKSSLAFDTIYAEGQRRYVESLSAYARQFLGQMDKPDVEFITGLSPTISIDQRTTGRNPRSTVGTATEIFDYLRLLYATVGIPHCPDCGKAITQQTVDQMVDEIMLYPEGTRLQIMAPVIRARKGDYRQLFKDVAKSGYVRVRVDGNIWDVNDQIELDRNKKHDIEIVVDRIVMKDGIQKRLTESVESALNLSSGLLLVNVIDGEDRLFSKNFACPDCGISIEELTPRLFSFNNPYGACPVCSGLGTLMTIDPDMVIPNKELSLREGAVNVTGWNLDNGDSYARMYIDGLCNHYHFDIDTPVKDLSDEAIQVLLYGTGNQKIKVKYDKDYGSGTYHINFEGIISSMERRYKETSSEGMKSYYEAYMSNDDCPACHGKRLKKESLAVTINGLNIIDVSSKSISEAVDFFKSLKLNEREEMISRQIVKEIKARLQFLMNVGLNYLTLSRTSATLSGGEAQRIRLATQVGSGLVGVLYILDEPSIGLHQRDNKKLLETLIQLRDLGNTLLVVEHDEETMYYADEIIDIGPGAGKNGGHVVCQGPIETIKKCEESYTGQYLSGKRKIEVPKERRQPNGKYIEVINATENNLKHLDVKIPAGLFTCVTGVSGSGKSSLVNKILYQSLAALLNRAKLKAGKHDMIKGAGYLDKVINIDQSPIGRTPRSNPATYTGMFDMIRDLYSQTVEAKVRGYNKGRFSFNVAGGRCEACKGDGIVKIEMHFLADVYVPCEVCKGKRYNRETLEVKYKGKNIFEVLDMTVQEAYEFFENQSRIKSKLETLLDVGLGYIKLGQPSTTLSGGEAQRIKLATELSKVSTGKTLYILDEPTTGLHMYDVHRLINILQKLTDNGNTVVVIEHNLEVIKTCDHIIDLGPEGGDQGGYIVAQGTPEEVAKVTGSYTGQFLNTLLSHEYYDPTKV
ncbi:MAG TPA: excinuclease ABC subunit UvrA [Clostridiales bacterium]|nr:excinuclease ABC subunit UvrA [Clostridiales bacterium]